MEPRGAARFFLSHASEDAAHAKTVLSELEKLGLIGWASFRDVKAGSSYDAVIDEALEQQDVLVVLLTDSALNSEHVRTEVSRAKGAGAGLIGIVESDEMKNEVVSVHGWRYHFELHQIQVVDHWTPDVANNVAQRVRDLAAERRPDVPDLVHPQVGPRPRPFDEDRAEVDLSRLSKMVRRLEDDVYDQSPELASGMSEVLEVCLEILVSHLRVEGEAAAGDGEELLNALGLGSVPVSQDSFWDPWPIPQLAALVTTAQGAVQNVIRSSAKGRPNVSLNAHANLVAWIERELLRCSENELSAMLTGLDRWLQIGQKNNGPYIHITPPQSREPGRKIKEWAENTLPRLARDGGITTIVGAGVNQIDARSARVVLDSNLMDLVKSDQTEPEVRKFFQALLKERLDDRSSQFSAAPPEREELVQVQYQLLCIAREATALLFNELAQAVGPIDDWDRLETNVRATDIAQRLESVAALLSKHVGLHGFGARAMQVRLEAMAEGIDRGLSGSEIEWLTDLFWHSYSFYATTYPRMSELALQVALVHESAGNHSPDRPRKRLEPVASVHRHDAKVVAESVKRGFVQNDKSLRREFYDRLAEVAFGEFDRWKGWSRKGRRSPLSIVLVTTFDLEMERALAARREGRYHVALPVLEPMDPPQSRVRRGKLRWLLGTFEPGETECPSLDELENAVAWRWADDLNGKEDLDDIEGPIVVKLDGSPMHVLPAQIQSTRSAPRVGSLKDRQGAARPDSASAPIHGVVLGEYDFLQYFQVELSLYARSQDSTNALPLWLFDAMKDDGRTWLLLGLRLADWNSRMQLFIHASRVLPGRGRFFAIQKEFDEDRASLLEAIGVERVDGDLRGLVGSLKEVLEHNNQKPGRRVR